MSNTEPGLGLNRIRSLVDGFRANLSTLKADQTPEAVIRQEYIDPFWIALDWDVANTAHRTAAEKDVVIEASVGTVEANKTRSRRPDYLFRIDGFPRFIVEAKKPSANLCTDRDAIFQAKTYAWSAQIPFALLTDFEELRLFDATIKPYYNEPDRGLIADFDLTFSDYIDQWDILTQTFSRASVAGGSLELLLAKIKRLRSGQRIRGIDRMLIDLRGSEPVDRVFLAHLEDYRHRFARAIYKENRSAFPEADTRHGAAKLTEATQRLIDRLVFARVCEDRDITNWGELRELVNQAAAQRLDVYAELLRHFREMDQQYNGYLFKPHFSEQLAIPAQLLADFIGSLYPPDGPYRFDAIGDDLLGIIYERFLGSTITVENGQVHAKEKPEVRHAGGVYYTPRFIVDTIIRRVIGPKIADKPPLDVLNVKILDPACGSGSFLIAAFQYLIDHCTRYLAKHPQCVDIPASTRARKKTRKIAFQDAEGQWNLAPDFKAQLLTSCLHGVDIDSQAVEVTIMSLYLKMLEGKFPPNWQQQWLDDRLLPSLDNNIRCGNSLLSQTDFDRYWDNKHGGLFGGDEDVRFRINAFDWTSQTRGFGRILKSDSPNGTTTGQDIQRQNKTSGGFDCIIGNPPYIRVQELNQWASEECEFYKSRYKSAAKGNYDIYVVFLERGLELLAPDGLLGFICPHKFWQAKYGEGIRKIIADGKHLRSIVDFADQQVFRGATTYTAVHVLRKDTANQLVNYTRITELNDGRAQCSDLDMGKLAIGSAQYAATHPGGPGPWVFSDAKAEQWLTSVKSNHPTLDNISKKIAQGIVTSADDVFILNKDGSKYKSFSTNTSYDLESEIVHPVLKGSIHMKRWVPIHPERYVVFPYEEHNGRWRLIPANKFESKYPLAWSYLVENRNTLEARESGKMTGRPDWYGYVYPKNLEVMSLPKILVPAIATHAEYCVDTKGSYHYIGSGGGGGGGHAIISDSINILYLCGILNSNLLDSYLQKITTPFHSGWFAYSKAYIAQLPIKLPESAEEKKLAKQIIERVEAIMAAKKQLQASQGKAVLSQRERDRLEREIEAHEGRIDELVCRLYGVDKVPQSV